MFRCCWQEGQVPGSRIREHGGVDLVPRQTPVPPPPNTRSACSWSHMARRGMHLVPNVETPFSYLLHGRGGGD